jgi:hypothetical protein
MPDKSVDLGKWAVVACDQYTSQEEYWKEVRKVIEVCPSAYNLMLPEIYLEAPDVDEKIKIINNKMKTYMEDGILRPEKPGLMLVQRKTNLSPMRTGLMIAIDLEAYDFNKGSASLIRATEETVRERIPPRMKIRKNACLEMPHIMLLIDDPDKNVIEPVAEMAEAGEFGRFEYNFELMMEGGHIRGYRIEREEIINSIVTELKKLADKENFNAKYNIKDKPVLLYAVGDGNHSLAAAKAHWEEVKHKLGVSEHPARYALVELLNVHDAGLVFEPIHRVLFNVDTKLLFDNMKKYFGTGISFDNRNSGKMHEIKYITETVEGCIYLDKKLHILAVGALQMFLDEFLHRNPQTGIDYIHGGETVDILGRKSGNVGFFLPVMDKGELFRTVIMNGVLPRKTFSMGEAEEKRYYLECRKIVD